MTHSVGGLDLSEHLGVRGLAEYLNTVPSNVSRMWHHGGIPASVLTKRGPLWSPEDAAHIKQQWDEYHRIGVFLYGMREGK